MKDKLYRWLAGKLPRRLVYFASIRLMANATMPPSWGSQIVPDLTAMDALARWEATMDKHDAAMSRWRAALERAERLVG